MVAGRTTSMVDKKNHWPGQWYSLHENARVYIQDQLVLKVSQELEVVWYSEKKLVPIRSSPTAGCHMFSKWLSIQVWHFKSPHTFLSCCCIRRRVNRCSIARDMRWAILFPRRVENRRKPFNAFRLYLPTNFAIYSPRYWLAFLHLSSLLNLQIINVYHQPERLRALLEFGLCWLASFGRSIFTYNYTLLKQKLWNFNIFTILTATETSPPSKLTPPRVYRFNTKIFLAFLALLYLTHCLCLPFCVGWTLTAWCGVTFLNLSWLQASVVC